MEDTRYENVLNTFIDDTFCSLPVFVITVASWLLNRLNINTVVLCSDLGVLCSDWVKLCSEWGMLCSK